MTIPVREFTEETAHEMHGHYREVLKKAFSPRPTPVVAKPKLIVIFPADYAPQLDEGPQSVEELIGLYALPFSYPQDETYSRPEFIKAAFRPICEHYDVTRAELEGRGRSGNISKARHVMMYLLSRKYGWSLPRIGRALGNRDHTTGLHALRKVRRMMAEDETFRHEVEKLSALMPRGIDE